MYLEMMNQWFILKQEGKGIDNFLRKKGYYRVAVYGLALYGRHVIRDLEGTDIKVLYGIDQKKVNPYKGVKVLQPTKELPAVDVILNTVLRDHSNIEKALAKITDIPVLNLEDVVFESY